MPKGDFRRVFIIGGLAVKVARLRNFSRGLRCNRWEREMASKWQPRFQWETLCPIKFADCLGLIVIMPAAGAVASEDEMQELDDAYTKEFSIITSEGKPDDYRWLNGRLVVVDYGLACAADVREQRAKYTASL